MSHVTVCGSGNVLCLKSQALNSCEVGCVSQIIIVVCVRRLRCTFYNIVCRRAA